MTRKKNKKRWRLFVISYIYVLSNPGSAHSVRPHSKPTKSRVKNIFRNFNLTQRAASLFIINTPVRLVGELAFTAHGGTCCGADGREDIKPHINPKT